MRIILLALTVFLSVNIGPPNVLAGTNTNGSEQLLPEDYVLAGIDGKLICQTSGRQVRPGPDKCVFEFESGINEGGIEVKAGQTIELLNSTTLEKMAADAKERTDARYRLWAKVTKYEGKNYLFAIYFVGLRKMDKPTGQPHQDGSAKKTPAVNSPNDVLNIPEEIVAKLATSEVLPTEEAPAGVQLKQDTIFANRVGRVVEKQGRYVFETDSLGRGIEKFGIELLPCQALEQAIDQVHSDPNPVRFNVAGILTKYKDGQYLLLQKATRVYSYGNFGR